MGPTDRPTVATNLQDLLTCNVLRSFVGADIFQGLIEHTFDTDAVDDHRVLLMKKLLTNMCVVACFTKESHILE